LVNPLQQSEMANPSHSLAGDRCNMRRYYWILFAVNRLSSHARRADDSVVSVDHNEWKFNCRRRQNLSAPSHGNNRRFSILTTGGSTLRWCKCVQFVLRVHSIVLMQLSVDNGLDRKLTDTRKLLKLLVLQKLNK